MPSVFIVGKNGKIAFVHSNPDYKVRLKGEEILNAIDAKCPPPIPPAPHFSLE